MSVNALPLWARSWSDVVSVINDSLFSTVMTARYRAEEVTSRATLEIADIEMMFKCPFNRDLGKMSVMLGSDIPAQVRFFPNGRAMPPGHERKGLGINIHFPEPRVGLLSLQIKNHAHPDKSLVIELPIEPKSSDGSIFWSSDLDKNALLDSKNGWLTKEGVLTVELCFEELKFVRAIEKLE